MTAPTKLLSSRQSVSRLGAALGLAGALALLGGCYDDGYGGGSVAVGYGAGGYYDDGYYGGGYGGLGYGGLGYGAGYGWYDNFYYPGSGLYVFDRGGGRHRLNDRQRAYWNGRRGGQPGALRGNRDGRPGYARGGVGRSGTGQIDPRQPDGVSNRANGSTVSVGRRDEGSASAPRPDRGAYRGVGAERPAMGQPRGGRDGGGGGGGRRRR